MADKSKVWYKFWPTNVPKHIEYPEIPLQNLLSKAAKEFPNCPAIEYNENKITYQELELLSDNFALGLNKIGIRKGDRVAVFLPNIPQFVIAYFGVLKANAVVTTISPLHKDREVKYQLINSGAKSIVLLDSQYPIIKKIWEKTKLQNVIITDLNWPLSEKKSFNFIFKDNIFNYKTILKQTYNPDFLTKKIDPKKDLAVLQYTGGTTGISKGAMLTHSNLISNAIMFAHWIQVKTNHENFLTVLPLFHIYGMTTSMNVPISIGAKMVLIPRFNPKDVLETIQKKRITVFCGVPTMYSLLLANKEIDKFNLTSIKICISGASPIPPEIQKQFMKITKGFLAEGYGLTEASPVTHCNPIDKTLKNVRIGSIGLPLSDTDAKILDIKNPKKELKIGEKGELAIHGPQVMAGYWQNSTETDLVLKDGWLLTGDIGKIDKDGYFYITDRKKDLIKYKDYSVYPREIEDVLYENSKVKFCAVIGKSTPIVGEIPKAFVVLKDNAVATEKEIMNFVNKKVAPYKAIRELEFRKKVPLSSVGKVLRRILKIEEEHKKSKK